MSEEEKKDKPVESTSESIKDSMPNIGDSLNKGIGDMSASLNKGIGDMSDSLNKGIGDLGSLGEKIPGMPDMGSLGEKIPGMPDLGSLGDKIPGMPDLGSLGKGIPDLGSLSKGLPPIPGLGDPTALIGTAFPAVGAAMSAFDTISSMIPADVPAPKLNDTILEQNITDLEAEQKKKTDIFKKGILEKIKKKKVEHLSNFSCKKNEKEEEDEEEYGDNSTNENNKPETTNLKTRIDQKIKCDHVKKIIVSKFVEFLDDKVLNSHFHSKDDNSNYKKSIQIFYRNGLSKIVSKMMDDVETNPEILDFFLREIIDYMLKLEDKYFISFFTDSIGDDKLLIDIMTDDNIIKFFQKNGGNSEMINPILLNTYSLTEFNDLISSIDDSEMSKDKKKVWIDKYNEIKIMNEIQNEEINNTDLTLLQKTGLDNVLTSLGLKKRKTIKNKIDFINQNTDFSKKDGGKKRKTTKHKSSSK